MLLAIFSSDSCKEVGGAKRGARSRGVVNMDRALLTRTLDTVKHLPPGVAHDFNVEEAGVLKAFLKSRENAPGLSPAEQALHRKIISSLGAWQGMKSAPKASRDQGADQRSQFTLREVIDKVQQDRWDEITDDEMQLVKSTYDVVSRCEDKTRKNVRLKSLLKQTLLKYEGHAKGRPANASESPTVFTGDAIANNTGPIAKPPKHQLMAATDFKGGTKKSLKYVGDIEADVMVRVFEYDGETVVAGDIPSDVLVTVKNGGITVDGFVAGNIVADESIIINNNVQGALIVSEKGDISVERCLLGTRLVAKAGNVACQHMEAPERVFAWGEVKVDGPILGGHVRAKNIRAKEHAVSAELHCCGDITLGAVESGPRSPTIICLRKALTSEDYGRDIDDENRQKSKRVQQLENEIDTIEEQDKFTHNLVHNCFRTALFYLYGGVDSAKEVMELQGLQIRLAHLGQILSLTEGIAKYFETVDEEDDSSDGTDHKEFFFEVGESLTIIAKDIEDLPVEFGAVHRRYVLDRADELKSLLRFLRIACEDDTSEDFLHDKFKPAASRWRAALGDCKRLIKEVIARFELEPDLLFRIENDPHSLEGMLEETLKTYCSGPVKNQRQRATSPLIRLLKTSASRFLKGIKRNQEKVVSARAEAKKLREELARDAVVLYGDKISGACRVTAGQFDRGVIFTTKPGKLDGFDCNVARVIVLSNPIKESTTFQLRDSLIQRQV